MTRSMLSRFGPLLPALTVCLPALTVCLPAGRALSSARVRAGRDAPVEDGVYSAGLLACERLSSWETAATLLNGLEEYGIEMAAEHFDAALRACDRKEKWQEALALFDRMRTRSSPRTRPPRPPPPRPPPRAPTPFFRLAECPGF